jgi:hypothetical protein
MDVVAATESLSLNGNMPIWLLMGMGVMACMYLTVRPRKKDPLAGGAPVRSSLAQQKALERDMQHVIVELSDLTRQMSAQLETRAAKLELLIRDADERIAELRATHAAALAPVSSAVVAVAEAAPRPQAAAPAAEPVPAMRLVKDPEDRFSEDRWNDVYLAADAGHSIAEICRTLGRPRGEVELILALRPKPRKVEATAAVG